MQDIYENPIVVEGEEYYEEPVSQLRGMKLIILFAWFLLLALLMWPMNLLHMGFMSLFYAMVGATLIIALIWLVIRWIKRRAARMELNAKQWGFALMGVTPPTVEGEGYLADGQERDLTTQRLSQTTELTERGLMVRPGMALMPLDEEEELPDTIIEPDGMYFSDTYMPALPSMIGENVLLVGERGFGKSNLLAVAAEEIGPQLVPILFIDPEDQFSPLAERKWFPHGFTAGDPDLQRVLGPQVKNFIPVTLKNARQVGRRIVSFNLQVVFNMKSYITLEDAASVLNEMVKGILEWEEEHENEDRLPVVFFFDEANKLLPQEVKEGGLRDKTVQDETYKTFFGLVNRGRNYGISIWFATQRIQQLHKNLLQCGFKFLFHQGQKVDLEQYQVFGLDALDVLSLRVGECFIFTPLIIGFKCFMRKRVSVHKGHTPGLSQLRRYQQTHQLHQVAQFSGQQVAGNYDDGRTSSSHLVEQRGFQQERTVHTTTQFYQPETVQETGQILEVPTVAATPQKPQRFFVNEIEVTAEEKLAYELHVAGNTTIALLAAALTADGHYGRFDNNRAYALRNSLIAKGLLHKKQATPVS